MKINVSSMSTLAIYEQIVNQVKDAIIKKELLPGDAMPSIRNLAKDLQISVITTKRAYEELEKEGLLKSVAGKGFYVCDYNTEFLKENQAVMLENRLAEVIKDCIKAGIPLEDILDSVKIIYDSIKKE